jgi:hypothetical protein
VCRQKIFGLSSVLRAKKFDDHCHNAKIKNYVFLKIPWNGIPCKKISLEKDFLATV